MTSKVNGEILSLDRAGIIHSYLVSYFEISEEVGKFVSDKVSTIDINPWFKATAGPVAGVATFGVANAAATRYIVPSIKQANVIGNVESNRSITEIAKSDTKSVGYKPFFYPNIRATMEEI